MSDKFQDGDTWEDFCNRAANNLHSAASIYASLQAAQNSLDAMAWPLIEYLGNARSDRADISDILPVLRDIAVKAEEMAAAIEGRCEGEDESEEL